MQPFPPRESVFIFRIGFDLYILGRGRPGPEAPQGPVPLLQPPPQVVEPTLEFYFIFFCRLGNKKKISISVLSASCVLWGGDGG